MNLSQEQINKIEEAIGNAAARVEGCSKDNYDRIEEYIFEQLNWITDVDLEFTPAHKYQQIMDYVNTARFSYFRENWE